MRFVLAFVYAVTLAIVTFYAGASLAEAAGAPPAPAPTPDLLATLAVHAGTIAVLIRGTVRVLRTDLLGDVWHKVPLKYRPVVLVGLGAAAVVFEHVALGESWEQAIFVALGGVGGAVTSHEMQERVTAKAPAPVDLPPAT